jgi:hypothetical protein
MEANVRRQQQEALASVSQTLFGKCIRGAARDSNALQARRQPDQTLKVTNFNLRQRESFHE